MATLIRKIWRNSSKHKKLSEEWALAECDGSEGWWGGEAACGAGVARYAGCAAVERAASAPATAHAVSSALHVAKESNRKMRRVNLTINPKGIVATDAETSENVINLSIYRISFCSADGASARVFAVVEGSGGGAGSGGDTHTAHVFVCSRRRHARSFALALAHAFNDAYLAWSSQQELRQGPCSARAASALGPAAARRRDEPWAWSSQQELRQGPCSARAASALGPAAARRRDEPWVSFPGESESDGEGEGEGEGAAWPEPAPLVTFA